MSESEEDASFARVWVKDEPDENITVEIDVIGDEHGGDEGGGDVMGAGEEETDPMMSVKMERDYYPVPATSYDENGNDDDDDGYDGNGDDGDGDDGNGSVDEDDIDPMKFVKSETATSETDEAETKWVPKVVPKVPKVVPKVTKVVPKVPIKKGNKYKCPYCPYTSRKQAVKKHMGKHTNNKDFQCPFCQFKTNYDAALRRHLKSLHSGSDEEKSKPKAIRKFSCTFCPYVTAHRHNLRSHVQGKHQDEKQHKCAFCPYETKYATALHRHRFTLHKNEVKKLGEASKEFKCSSCDFVAFLKCELKQHEKKHLFKFKCHGCRYKAETYHELALHVSTEHDKTPDIAIKTESKNIKKESELGSSADPIFKCKLCEHEALSYVAFLEHVKTHDKVDPYKCNVCGYETADNSNFLEHLQSAHGVSEDGMNDLKVIKDGIMSAMQAISAGAAPDSDDEPLASHYFGDDFTPPKLKKKRVSNQTYACDLCTYTTTYKGALKHHMGKHATGKPYKCPLCEYRTKHVNSMRRHKLIKHADNDPVAKAKLKEYVCHICSYKTYYKNNLNLHLRKHNAEKPFKCEFCSFGTVYRTAFIRHAKTHGRKQANGEPIQLECDMCPYTTMYEGRFAWHMLKTHNRQGTIKNAVKCEYCNFETSDKLKFRLTAHLQRSKKSVPMKCLHCDFETYYKCQVNIHRKSHYPEIKAIVPLPKLEDANQGPNADAPEDLGTKNNVVNVLGNLYDPYKDEVHNYEIESAIAWKKIPVLENRSNNKPFSCYKCTYCSRYKSSVQRHFQRIHGNKIKPYRCSHCDFGTSTKDSIALHTKRSKQNKVLSCECGEFTTIYKCEYVTHQKLHNPYRCSKCPYSSRSKYDLERHYTMHSNKGYKCRFCTYIAMRRDTLISHEVIHTGVRPYQCHLCPYGSIRLSFLEKHIMQKHDGDATKTKPFQCHACPYGSFSQVILDKHISQSHPETNQEESEPIEAVGENDDRHSVTENFDSDNTNVNTTYYDDATQNIVTIEAPVVPPTNTSVTTVERREVVEKPAPAKPFQCHVCAYSAFSPKVLKKHMAIHTEAPAPEIDDSSEKTGVKPFQCHLCPYSSFRPNILKNHLILKHSITPPSGFIEEYNAKQSEKTYQCHICSYSSMSLNVLNKHLVLKHETNATTAAENTVKTFQCHHCPFNSLNSNVLKKHVIQTHAGIDVSTAEGVKPYRCHVCPYSTFSPKVLKKHVSQRHPGLPRSAFESYSDNSVEMISVVSEND